MENIEIRIFKQFIVLSLLRIIFIEKPEYVLMTPSIVCIFIGLSILLTILFECFDRLIIDGYPYFKYAIIILLGGLVLAYLYGTNYHFAILLYISVILIKDTFVIAPMQTAMKNYQKREKD